MQIYKVLKKSNSHQEHIHLQTTSMTPSLNMHRLIHILVNLASGLHIQTNYGQLYWLVNVQTDKLGMFVIKIALHPCKKL